MFIRHRSNRYDGNGEKQVVLLNGTKACWVILLWSLCLFGRSEHGLALELKDARNSLL